MVSPHPSPTPPNHHPPPPPPPADHPTKFEFENAIVGNAIPPNFIPAVEKGFREAVNSGALIGHPVEARRGGGRAGAAASCCAEAAWLGCSHAHLCSALTPS